MSTLQQRINDYLRHKVPRGGIRVEEADPEEYKILRARSDMQAARDRLVEFEQALAARASAQAN